MAASESLKSGTNTSITMPGFNLRTCSMVLRKCSAPPSARSSRATAVMTTCFNRIRRVASATRAGSSASSANGFAVETAQNPQARVQRSPAIMKVAVPLLQHSQWFGHLALSQTVCSFNSSSNARVCEKVSDVGSLMRSHSGKRGRGLSSAGLIAGISFFQFVPEGRELIRPEVSEDFPVHIDHRREFLTGQSDHLVESGFVSDDIHLFVFDAPFVEP